MSKMKTLLITLIVLTGFVQAQNLGLKTVRPMIGLTFPESPWDMGFSIGADVDLGEITENLHLLPGLAYWSNSYTQDLGFLGTFDLTMSNFRIGANAFYYLPNIKGFYAGGGLSLNFLGSDATGTKLGVDFLAGYEYPLKDITLFGQAKYDIVADFSQFVVEAGVVFDIK